MRTTIVSSVTKLTVCSIATIITFVLVVASSFAVDTNRILLYWSCDDAGDTLTDASGHGWDATILDPGNSEWVDGQFEGGVRLQATCAQVDGNIIESTGNTGEITLMCWFIMYQHSTYNGLIDIESPEGDCCEYRLMVNPSKNPFWNAGHHVDKSLASFAFEMETWYHYAMTADGDVDKIYVDGEFIGEQVEGFDLPTFDDVTVYLGTGEKPGTWTVEDSTFDEVMIWDKALSQDEIQEVMLGGLLSVSPMDKLATTWSSLKTTD